MSEKTKNQSEIKEIKEIYCRDACCKLLKQPYVKPPKSHIPRPRLGKSGVFIYDPNVNKILIVQSCGKLWGFPKGSIEQGETSEQTSIREVYEETGIRISSLRDCKYIKIYNNVYYIMEMSETETMIQDTPNYNDASGVGWIKASCLVDLVRNKKISMNCHFKLLFNKLLSIDLNLQSNTLQSNILQTNTDKTN